MQVKQIIHLSIVRRTPRPPGMVRHGWVIYQQINDAGYGHGSIWSVTAWRMGCVKVDSADVHSVQRARGDLL